VSAADPDPDYPLYALFVELTKGAQRSQWMIYPPARGAARRLAATPAGSARFMRRKLEHAEHRAKWQWSYSADGEALLGQALAKIEQYASQGWEARAPIVIAIEEDDYLKAMSPTPATPNKALRHVNRVAKLRGYRVV